MKLKGDKTMKTKTILSITILALMILAACTLQTPGKGQGPSPVITLSDKGDELKKFSSRQEIVDFLKDNAGSNYNYYSTGIGREVMALSMDSAAPMAKAESSSSGGAGTASDFSRTNVQVEGGDEADFVKNEGKYMYSI